MLGLTSCKLFRFVRHEGVLDQSGGFALKVNVLSTLDKFLGANTLRLSASAGLKERVNAVLRLAVAGLNDHLRKSTFI